MPKNRIIVRVDGEDAAGKTAILEAVIGKAFKDFDMSVSYHNEGAHEIAVEYDDDDIAFIEQFHVRSR